MSIPFTATQRGRIAASLHDPSFVRSSDPGFVRLEKHFLRDPRTSKAIARLQQRGIDKDQFIVELLNLARVFQEGQRRNSRAPIFRSKERKRYEQAIRKLATDLNNNRQLLETYILPMLAPDDRSNEARALRSRLPLDTLKTAIEMLKSLGLIFEELRDCGVAPKFVKADQNTVNVLFGVPQLDIVQTAKPLRDLHVKPAVFLRWCEANYSGRQLCGDVSPLINAAFEMFNVQVGYPKSFKALGTFLSRHRKKTHLKHTSRTFPVKKTAYKLP